MIFIIKTVDFLKKITVLKAVSLLSKSQKTKY